MGMTIDDLQKYINALRKCAKEHDNDTTYTGHIIVSDLCRDTANLLESLEQELTKIDCKHTDCNNCVNHKYCDYESTTKNDLGVDCISRAEVLKLMQDNWHTHNGDWAMQESMDDIRALPSVTPQEPILDKIRAEIEQITDIMGVSYNQYVSKIDVLQILDKYKAETEADND